MGIDRKNELLVRVYLMMIVFILIVGCLLTQLVKISNIEREKWKIKPSDSYLKWKPVKVRRGNIFSDDGERLLATSIEFFEIRMDPAASSDADFDKNIRPLCKGLTELIGNHSAEEWYDKIAGARYAYYSLKKKGSRDILISKKVDDELLSKIKKLPLFNLGKNKGGLIIKKSFERKKTYNEMCSRTIGVYRDDHLVGLERSYDEHLRGRQTKELMRFVPPDLWIPMNSPADYEVHNGNDVKSTIDVEIQDIVHYILKEGILENDAEAGVAIIMEMSTGQIKAISNLENQNGTIVENYNRAVLERTAPGSTFKAATVLALLESGVRQDQKVLTNHGRMNFHDLTMFDSNYPHKYDSLQMSECFIFSSNVGIANLANQVFGSGKGKNDFYQYLEKFGLTEKSGIDLIGEKSPIIKNPNTNDRENYYSGVTIPWMAHGYELQISPLQMLSFYNAIANDGKYVEPMLVTEITKDGKKIETKRTTTKRKNIAKKENVKILKNLMKEVVTRGTGKNLKSKYNLIAGKTGTASLNFVNDENKEYNASFAGYFPADNPQYSMIVFVYGLNENKYYGSKVAGPIFKNIADWVTTIKGGIEMEYVSNYSIRQFERGNGEDWQVLMNGMNEKKSYDFPKWVDISPENNRITSKRSDLRRSKVPDVRGMGLRDALYILENLGMNVKTTGYGKVVFQSIPAGSNMKNKNIEILLK